MQSVWDKPVKHRETSSLIDTLAASYLPSTAIATAAAADRKCAKYDILSKTYHFVPLAYETLGMVNNSGHLFITELGRCLSRFTGDTRETSHLYQRISITIQRFNAIAFQGSFVPQDLAEC